MVCYHPFITIAQFGMDSSFFTELLNSSSNTSQQSSRLLRDVHSDAWLGALQVAKSCLQLVHRSDVLHYFTPIILTCTPLGHVSTTLRTDNPLRISIYPVGVFSSNLTSCDTNSYNCTI